MEKIHIGGASLNQIPLDIEGNTARILKAISAAKEKGVQLLCLPELCITGYGCEDAFYRQDVLSAAWQALLQILPAVEDMVVIVGLPYAYQHQVYNAAVVLAKGEILGCTLKSQLAGDSIYYEPRWFKSWPSEVVAEDTRSGMLYLIGQPVYEVNGIRFAIEICEDAWSAERPAVYYHKAAPDIILNPTASDFSMGKTHLREQLVCEASRAFSCVYVYTNLLGNESGRVIYDGEILIASGGEKLLRNRRFSYQDVVLRSCLVDVSVNRFQRSKKFHLPHPDFPEAYICRFEDMDWSEGKHRPDVYPVIVAESVFEEFARAAALGMFDYMRKSYSRGFVLSLSGGADSSACLVLAVTALWNVIDELGEEGLREKVPYLDFKDADDVIRQLITCVYQSTEHSSLQTLESAESLAKGLGVDFHIWDVDHMRHAYTHLVESSIGRTLEWETDDLAMQNIQARIRVPALWMLANVKSALLITTSNRSESSVGYTTMDGDSAGGLAPLAGVSKSFIRSWLQWAEEGLNIPELSFVNQLQPSAELRPGEEQQTDEADLMPYDILNAIESAFVYSGIGREDIVAMISQKFPEAPAELYVHRFLKLFTANQWKRERIAPSFHLDKYNIDPRSGFRFPILSKITGF
jgi:NAD+ synthase (glutamine-hydrolysing)